MVLPHSKMSFFLFWATLFVGFLSFDGLLSGPQPNPLQEFFCSQPLDHFGIGNMSKIMFRQRYFLDRTNWAGAKSKNPMIVSFAGEYPVNYDIQNLGVINEAATKFGALVLYIEHRFYGMSVPFGSIDIALGDANVRECLNSEQALEDFALIILDVKKKLFNPNTKIIVTGCSYAGMLAAWFRLKYPYIAIGALAASAPIFYFEPSIPSQWENEFCSIVSNDFKVVNEKCYQRIKKSWDIIDKISLLGLEGSAHLADVFKSCSPFISASDLKHSLLKYYSFSAQYNGRYNGGIGKVCDEIIRAPDDDVLGGIARSVLNGRPCYDLEYYMNTNTTTTSSVFENNATRAWDWQTCSEFIFRQGCGNDSMFQPRPFNLTKRINDCNSKYHVRPRLNWMSTYFDGHDMRSTLERFGSNIVFSNGLMDPFSHFGVLEDISKTLVALTTKKGSHCLDFDYLLHDDPKWLKLQREKELKMFSRWINNHSSNSPQILFNWFCFGLVFTLLL